MVPDLNKKVSESEHKKIQNFAELSSSSSRGKR